MKKLLLMPMLLLLAGCQRPDTVFVTPAVDVYGNAAQRVHCNWTWPSKCYTKAKTVCKDGYYLVEENMGDGLFLHIEKNIVIRCKAPSPQAAPAPAPPAAPPQQKPAEPDDFIPLTP